jgi:hypothetical protein
MAGFYITRKALLFLLAAASMHPLGTAVVPVAGSAK